MSCDDEDEETDDDETVTVRPRGSPNKRAKHRRRNSRRIEDDSEAN